MAKLEYSHCEPGSRVSFVAAKTPSRSRRVNAAYGLFRSVMRHGNDGKPDVWVTMSRIVISRPPYDGTLVPGGSSLAIGSVSAISSRATKSASSAAVIVLVTEPISNALRSS